ncbi:MAG: hypothetical protein E7342_02065 [Clostridiales bacterium]|nr:hypothetical protein [Clostridiales bacterium]
MQFDLLFKNRIKKLFIFFIVCFLILSFFISSFFVLDNKTKTVNAETLNTVDIRLDFDSLKDVVSVSSDVYEFKTLNNPISCISSISNESRFYTENTNLALVNLYDANGNYSKTVLRVSTENEGLTEVSVLFKFTYSIFSSYLYCNLNAYLNGCGYVAFDFNDTDFEFGDNGTLYDFYSSDFQSIKCCLETEESSSTFNSLSLNFYLYKDKPVYIDFFTFSDTDYIDLDTNSDCVIPGVNENDNSNSPNTNEEYQNDILITEKKLDFRILLGVISAITLIVLLFALPSNKKFTHKKKK